ncbi:response regulator [Kamptonema sp. UHCC 0994]|uniref:response regulator n=1 Tax=Kamptonema sp. UHCC 0994 TaxID=3031329 RepID=UPI0023BA4530|nr:response regulator [Kamptonema sp. UHCC 0994]MDF0556719.1 response regulator [Kamptonema sp. UHCC 0994]
MEEVLKVLIVDDDEVDRMAVRRALKIAGLRVEVAEAGGSEEAKLLLLAAHSELTNSAEEKPITKPFDCAFLDYRLPDGDGLTLVKAIREIGIKIPLIVLTGQGDEQIAVEVMKAGASDYIAKAKLSPENLSRSLQNAIRIYRAETKAMQASQKLKESEERYRLVLEGANDGIWDWDLSKNEVYWNDRLLEIVGLSRSEFGSAIEAFFNRLHPEDSDSTRKALEAHLETGTEYNVEFRLLHSSAIYRYCTGRGKAQRNHQGKALRMAGIISDISDRKLAEAALERERQQLRQIIACVPVPMAMFDKEMRYQAHSQRWLTQYNLEGQSILNRSYYEVLPDTPDRWKTMHERSLTGEVVSVSEDAWKREDGSTVFLRWAIHPWYDPDGEVGGIVLVSDRINELVEAREAAIEASRVKSQFLANMSHEIRTPMNGVLGMAQLLLRLSLEPKSREYAQTIYRSAEHLLSVINDILDFSKIEAGEMRLENLDFDLDTCIESMVEMVVATAEEKVLELNVLIESSVPRQLQGDPGRLRQILLNLVNNAIKFTDRGQVLVRVSLRSTNVDKKLIFSVRDSGIGISPEGQKKLFQSFSQVDGSPTRQYGGTGLGLVICKQLVEMMGGEIGVRTSVGKGSNFWFAIPLQIQPQPVEGDARSPLAGTRLLVVSHSALTRAVARAIAEARGAYCNEAEDATAALAVLEEANSGDSREEDRYTAVFLDLQLSRLDAEGFAAFVRSLAIPPLLIPMTSLRDRNKAEALCSLGAANYLIKPLRASQFCDRLLPEKTVEEEKEFSSVSITNQDNFTTPNYQSSSLNYQSSVKILLAEDHYINQQVILSQLAVLGYQADCATNGQEALKMLDSQSYDIVLMDCQMPILDGYATTKKLRELEADNERENSSHKTVIIALTAHAMPGEREKCLAAGMDDYLSKPVDIEDLAAMLKKYESRTNQSENDNNNYEIKTIKTEQSLPLETDNSNSPIKTESGIIASHNVTIEPTNALESLEDTELDLLLDRKRLQQIGRVNTTLPKRLLKAFIDSVQVDIESAKVALLAKDWSHLEHQAHRIKGTSSNVGVRLMADLADRLERQARDCQNQPLPESQTIEGGEELLATLSSHLARVKAFIQSRNW